MADNSIKKKELENLGVILREAFGKPDDAEWASFRADLAPTLLQPWKIGGKR